MKTEPQSRFEFPIPNEKHLSVMAAILELMKDGRRRSKKDIRSELGLDPDTEITARIRDLRKPEHGAWAFNNPRSEGPDDDGVYRYQLKGPKPKPEHIVPPLDSEAYQWHRESCDTCYGKELEEDYRRERVRS